MDLQPQSKPIPDPSPEPGPEAHPEAHQIPTLVHSGRSKGPKPDENQTRMMTHAVIEIGEMESSLRSKTYLKDSCDDKLHHTSHTNGTHCGSTP